MLAQTGFPVWVSTAVAAEYNIFFIFCFAPILVLTVDEELKQVSTLIIARYDTAIKKDVSVKGFVSVSCQRNLLMSTFQCIFSVSLEGKFL